MSRTKIIGEMFRFGVVGALGFVVDSVTLYAGLWVGLGLYSGRLLSYLVAASFTWFCNRSFTFRSSVPPSIGEWLRFLVANGFGGLLNLSVYTALVASDHFVAAHPVLGVAAGSLAGMTVNFVLSRYAVFRSR